jgi:hypothetical protein
MSLPSDVPIGEVTCSLAIGGLTPRPQSRAGGREEPDGLAHDPFGELRGVYYTRPDTLQAAAAYLERATAVRAHASGSVVRPEGDWQRSARRSVYPA